MRLNLAVQYSATHVKISWMAVEFPAKAIAIFKALGKMSQTDALMSSGTLRHVARQDARSH